MQLLKRFSQLISTLDNIKGSRTEKENILKEYVDDDDIKKVLKFVFDPYIITGLSTKKINKFNTLDQVKLLQLATNSEISTLLDLLDYIESNNTGRDGDIATIELFCQNFLSMNLDLIDLLKNILTKDIKLGIQPITLNKIFGPGFIPIFEVMLADRYFDNPEKYLPYGTKFILSEKLDGIRGVAIKDNQGDVKFLTRSGQLITGLIDIEDELSLLPNNYVYDGELLLKNDQNLLSKDLYRATVKIVNSDNQEKRNIIFHCFDCLPLDDFKNGHSPICAYDRKNTLQILTQDCKWVKALPNLYIGDDQEQITYWLNNITSHGGEGVMINISHSPYECKRSRGLLKVKKMQTCDLLCIGMEEGKGVNKGRLGALICNLPAPDGKVYELKVGGGFTHELRSYFWLNKEKIINHIVEIQYFEQTQNQEGGYSLRFPIFLQIRDDKTEPSMY